VYLILRKTLAQSLTRSWIVDTDKVYLIPIDHVGTTQANLRLAPTANHQEKYVRWAKDYEL
jgi:hypothetical protein